MQRAVIYCRVDGPASESTQEAVLAQRARLEAYARSRGMEITGVYVDNGFSGLTLDRPGLRALMRDVETGNAEALLVVNRSRLFRGPMPEELCRLPVKIHPLKERGLER